MKLYHGTVQKVKKPALKRCREKTDFGKGFYTTTDLEQATKWAILKSYREEGLKPMVSVFEIDESTIKRFKVREYSQPTAEWLDFVVANRRGKPTEKYDIVKGPVANDKLYATIKLYEQGTLSVHATIEQLQTHRLFNQVSFHSSEAISLLRFVEIIEINL